MKVLSLTEIVISKRQGTNEELGSRDDTKDLTSRGGLSRRHDGEGLLVEFESLQRIASEEGDISLVKEQSTKEAFRGIFLDIVGGRERKGGIHFADMASQMEEIVAHVEVAEPVGSENEWRGGEGGCDLT